MVVPLLIILIVLVLGIINIIIGRVTVKRQKTLIKDYIDAVFALVDKIEKMENYAEEAVFVLSNTEEVAKIEDAKLYSIVYDLKNDITRKDIYGIVQTSQKIGAESIVWMSRLDKQLKELSRQFANPFILFYKGIELILYIVFGYFLKIVNPSFDFQGKGWKVFNVVFSVVSGSASIIALILELIR